MADDKKPMTWEEEKKLLDMQAICSHDAPGQQAGAACIRCGKMLPAKEAPVKKVAEKVESPISPEPKYPIT
jgi:hypothetical protein